MVPPSYLVDQKRLCFVRSDEMCRNDDMNCAFYHSSVARSLCKREPIHNLHHYVDVEPVTNLVRSVCANSAKTSSIAPAEVEGSVTYDIPLWETARASIWGLVETATIGSVGASSLMAASIRRQSSPGVSRSRINRSASTTSAAANACSPHSQIVSLNPARPYTRDAASTRSPLLEHSMTCMFTNPSSGLITTHWLSKARTSQMGQ